MTATNHALTGALIGLSTGHPIAMLLALGSHFALDAIPHYSDENFKISSNGFAVLLVSEATVCFLIVLMLGIKHPEHWILAAFCAFLATSPDFMWVPQFIRARQGKKETKLTNPIARFHSWIQWHTTPRGAIVEVIWAVIMISLLAKII